MESQRALFVPCACDWLADMMRRISTSPPLPIHECRQPRGVVSERSRAVDAVTTRTPTVKSSRQINQSTRADTLCNAWTSPRSQTTTAVAAARARASPVLISLLPHQIHDAGEEAQLVI